MSQKDIEVEEYKSLRSSIDMHLKLIPEILAFMVAATSALLGYGFSTKNAFVFLTPLLVILPCAYLIQSQMNEVLRKGAYIMKQYEQEDQLWESTLYKYRQEREKGKKSILRKAAGDSLAIVSIIDSLAFLCLSGFVYLYFGLKNLLVLVVLGSIVIFVVILIFLNIRILEAYTSEKEKDFLDDLDFKKLSK